MVSRKVSVDLRNRFMIFTTVLALFGAFTTNSALAKSSAKSAKSSKKKHSLVSFEGKISGLRNGRDKKKKRYWEYKLRTASGKTVLVHDYQYGRYRQPASVGIREGAKKKVRGFFVQAYPKPGASRKVPVLIVTPSN